MTSSSARQLLGLAARAGAVVPGSARVASAARAGELSFALVAEDLTDTGRDRLVPVLEREGVRFVVRFTRAELGHAVGRSPLAGVGVADAGFGDRLVELLGDG